MKPPRQVLAITAAAGAIIAGGILAAQPGAANPVGTARMTLVASSPDTSALVIPCAECFVQRRPDGAHIGGTEYDSGTLSDTTGQSVGHFALESVGMTPFGAAGPGELQLTAALVINGDQLLAQGLEEPPLGGGAMAIIGGTGRFRGARGEIRYTDNADNSTNLIIDLRP